MSKAKACCHDVEKTLVTHGVTITAYGIEDEQELMAYYERGRKKYGRMLQGMTVWMEDNGDVSISYDIGHVPFQRIRRITGYLVGGMDRWNNAKRVEEGNRVKHGG